MRSGDAAILAQPFQRVLQRQSPIAIFAVMTNGFDRDKSSNIVTHFPLEKGCQTARFLRLSIALQQNNPIGLRLAIGHQWRRRARLWRDGRCGWRDRHRRNSPNARRTARKLHRRNGTARSAGAAMERRQAQGRPKDTQNRSLRTRQTLSDYGASFGSAHPRGRNQHRIGDHQVQPVQISALTGIVDETDGKSPARGLRHQIGFERDLALVF